MIETDPFESITKLSHPEIRLSKFLTRLLRHNPEIAEVELDEEGWAVIKGLIDSINSHTRYQIDFEILNRIVEFNNKRRFEINDGGDKIRARYGHSIEVKLGLEVEKPPSKLYHGTSIDSVNSILTEGLTPQGRQFVHLSSNPGIAADVGKRRGNYKILEVDAASMYKNGSVFYNASDGVWLTNYVPQRHLSLLE